MPRYEVELHESIGARTPFHRATVEADSPEQAAIRVAASAMRRNVEHRGGEWWELKPAYGFLRSCFARVREIR